MARRQKTQPAAVRRTAGANVPELRTRSREALNGIKLDVPGGELAVRLTERIRWHRDKADTLLLQMKKLRELERDGADDLASAVGRYDSPLATLEKKVSEHRERAGFLTFVRDHISPDQVYRLDSTDLRMTEILPEKPW